MVKTRFESDLRGTSWKEPGRLLFCGKANRGKQLVAPDYFNYCPILKSKVTIEFIFLKRQGSVVATAHQRVLNRVAELYRHCLAAPLKTTDRYIEMKMRAGTGSGIAA